MLAFSDGSIWSWGRGTQVCGVWYVVCGVRPQGLSTRTSAAFASSSDHTLTFFFFIVSQRH